MENFVSQICAFDKWVRLFWMVAFFLFHYVIRFGIILIALIQFLFMLLTGSLNQHLKLFSAGLCQLSYQIILYLTYNSEDKPFPFASWPE